MRFLDVAQTIDAVGSTRGTHAKRDLVADLLARADVESLPHVARFVSGSPFARVDSRVLQVGWSTLEKAALSMMPLDQMTWRACHGAVGDSGETLELLMAAYPPKRQGAQRTLFDVEGPQGEMSALDAFDAYARLAAAPSAAKPRLLEETWRRLTPLEAKVFTKIMTGGMRIGLSETLVEDAVARAFGREASAVRMANMISGDIGETALQAKEDRLGEAVFRMFHPLGFMLANPLDEAPDDPTPYAVEDKLDGIRAQLHARPGRAELYTRTLEDAGEFPELVEAARRLTHEVVLDGEVIAVRHDGRVAPFALLQRRLGRKDVTAAMRAQVPVRYVAYDIMFLDGQPLYTRPWTERRAALESLGLAGLLSLSPARRFATKHEAEMAFEEARARGNEGLMFKLLASPYEFGKRGNQWLKLKRAFATLDVVVTAAELGHGKRAGLLSDVTFAVRAADGTLVNVGKAYTGLTDEEIRRMTAQLRQLTLERYANVHVVRPEIVLEIAFDSVTRSKRHKSGFALRFPRIARWRTDKPVSEIDTVARVEELWRLSGGAETLES